jgi:hypothetical protein
MDLFIRIEVLLFHTKLWMSYLYTWATYTHHPLSQTQWQRDKSQTQWQRDKERKRERESKREGKQKKAQRIFNLFTLLSSTDWRNAELAGFGGYSKACTIRHPATAVALLRCIHLHKISLHFSFFMLLVHILWWNDLSINQITQLLSKLNRTKTQKRFWSTSQILVYERERIRIVITLS